MHAQGGLTTASPIRLVSVGDHADVLEATAQELEHLVPTSGVVVADHEIPDDSVSCIIATEEIVSHNGEGLSDITIDGERPIIVLTNGDTPERGLLDDVLSNGRADLISAELATDHPSLLARRIFGLCFSNADSIDADLPPRQAAADRGFTGSAINALRDIFFVIDESGAFLRWNNQLQTVTGYEDEEIVEMHPRDFIADEDGDEIWDAVESVFENGGALTRESALVTKGGDRIPYEVNVSLITDADGEVIGLAGTGRDITERKQRERELQEEKEFTESVLDTLPDVFFLADEDGSFLRWNDRLNNVTGYTDDEIAEMHPTNFVPGEDTEMVEETVKTVFEEGTTEIRETHLITTDGERIPYEVNGSLLTDSDGEVIGLAGIGRDITERKEQERELQEEKEFTESVLDTLPDVFFVADEDGSFLRWNEHLKEVTGYSDDEIAEMHPTNFVPGEDTEMVEETVQTVFEKGTTEIRETHLITKDGERIPHEVNGSLLTDSDGEVIGLAGIGRDITERKEQERELQEEKEFTESVLDTLPDVFFVADEDGSFVRWNEHLKEVTGYTDDEIAEMHPTNFVPGEDTEMVEETVQTVFEKGTTEIRETHLITKDGERIPHEVNGSLLTNSDGEVIGLAGIGRDITERKEHERELREAKEFTESVLDTLPDVFFLADEDGSFLRWNQHLKDVTGYTDDEIAEMHPTNFVPGEDTEMVEQTVKTVFEEGTTEIRETHLITKDGERVPHEVNGSLLRDSDGEVIGLAGIGRDITERKQREQEIQDQRALLDRILETAPVGIGVFDAAGHITRVNSRARQLFDLPEVDSVESGTIGSFDIYDESGQLLDTPEHPNQRVLRTGRPINNEELRFASANDRWLSVSAAPIIGSDGDIDQVVTITEDVTERKAYERELEQRKNELQTELNEIFGRISDAVFALDDEWLFNYVNERAEDFIGYTEEELLHENAWRMLPAAEGIPFELEAKRAMQAQTSVQTEEYYPALDTWFDVRVYPSETGVSVYFRDITERKEQERALQESERRYRTLAEQFPDGLVTMFDDNCQHTLVAGQAFDDLDLSPSDFEGETVREVYDDDVADILEPAYQTALDGDATSLDIEYEERDWAVHTVPLINEDEEVFAGMAMAQDITQRKQRERELKRYETLIEQATDVNAILTPDGEFQYLTPSVERVLGYEPDDLIGKSSFDFIHEDDHEGVRSQLSEAVEQGHGEQQNETVEFRFVDTDGSWVVFEGRSRNLLEEPLIEGVVAYTHDITERKRLEEELRETVQDLEESNERLEQFAYAASHDLQEPLRMISSYLQLVEDRYAGKLDQDGREFIDFAVDGAGRMRQMINDLLAYARISKEARPLEPTDCSEVLERVLDDLRIRIEETDATIAIVDEPLPTVMGDNNQLGQLFRNLISNALKYSGDAPPRIEVATTRRNGWWQFSVTDHGVGIESHQLDRIFEVFTRLQTNDESSGTGIGLALCQRIIERHDGDIWVDSEPGVGTTFHFTIPAEE